jgi:outer membrane immunogenic protein
MKKNLLAVALLSVTATGAMAQSAFEGFYGQAGIGYSAVSPSLSNSSLTSPSGTNYPFSTSISNSSSFNGVLSAGYTFNLDKQFTLGLGVDYQPFAGQETNYSLSNSSLSPSTSTGKWKQNNAFNVYIAPGVAVTKDSLVYAKLGYAATQIKVTPDGGTSGTDNLSGYLVGLGYKQIITGGLYGFGEINYTSYGNKTSNGSGPWASGGTYTTSTQVSANAMNVLVGVGYKF